MVFGGGWERRHRARHGHGVRGRWDHPPRTPRAVYPVIGADMSPARAVAPWHRRRYLSADGSWDLGGRSGQEALSARAIAVRFPKPGEAPPLANVAGVWGYVHRVQPWRTADAK